MKAQPFNHFISQMWSISFTDSDIIYESSTTQPFNIPNLMSLPHSLCFCAWNLESSTTQPLHLPNVLYLLHSLWYHSWKLNHSTTSSPNYSLSLLPPSLISFLWDQPLNHFISQNLVFLPHSLCFYSWKLNHSTTSLSHLWYLSFTHSDVTLESSTTQPLHLPTLVFLNTLSMHQWW